MDPNELAYETITSSDIGFCLGHENFSVRYQNKPNQKTGLHPPIYKKFVPPHHFTTNVLPCIQLQWQIPYVPLIEQHSLFTNYQNTVSHV